MLNKYTLSQQRVIAKVGANGEKCAIKNDDSEVVRVRAFDARFDAYDRKRLRQIARDYKSYER